MGRRPKAPKAWFPPTHRPPRILLVRLSALGDVLHALPVLSALRTRYPEAQIHWAIEDRHTGLLDARSDLDRLVVYPRRNISSALRGIPSPLGAIRAVRGFLRSLRQTRYDVVLDLQGNLKSGAITRLARSKVRMGFHRRAARELNHLFTNRRWLPPESLRHRVERGLGLASALVGEPLPYSAPGFPVDPQARDAAARIVAQQGVVGAYVVMHPGTSGFGAFKRWPADRYAAVARQLAAAGTAVMVTAGPGETELAQRVCDLAAHPDVHRVQPPSLGALAALIDGARGFLGADTGPLHLAGLVETPLVGLFGPKDPTIYGPYGIRPDHSAGLLTTLTQDDVACRPCTRRRCADPLCMRTLAPDRVHAALQTLL